MSTTAQADIWNDLTAVTDFGALVQQARNPDEFQSELKRIIDPFLKDGSRILEAGCFTGVTSLSLDDAFQKTLLDLSPGAVALSEKLFRQFDKKATFVVGDMFDMPFPDGSFDVVFNAGVLEHFDFQDRVRALREYGRVLKGNGVMIIAYPNHYSRPYRLAYEYLNRIGKWSYPEEERLYDLKEEIEAAGLSLQKRLVVAKKTSFSYLATLDRVRRVLFTTYFSFAPYEGYLTAVVIGKRQ